MTDALRKRLNGPGATLYRVSVDTGVTYASLLRFARGDQSLRLDQADKLADYFGIVPVERRKKGR